MQALAIGPDGVSPAEGGPEAVPAGGFVWIGCTREEFRERLPEVQATLRRLAGSPLLDLHVSDLLNAQLPSHHDETTRYDLLVLRRLMSRAPGDSAAGTAPARRRAGPPVLQRIDTGPVGFALFDRVLLSVHPAECPLREAMATRLLASHSGSGDGPEREGRHGRVPASAADLMLRSASQIVDGFLDLRRELTRQLDHWQDELLQPRTRFTNWGALLDARMTLHQLDEVCEDQRLALLDWIESLKTWPAATGAEGTGERELLMVRSRDVLEHIERVVHHVRRLEHGVETAVQLHFSAQGKRTNDIMRTLTALTAIFLPLNLIAAIFGMNFEFLPLIHQQSGFWWALGGMAAIAVGMGLVFWRKRYLARSGR